MSLPDPVLDKNALSVIRSESSSAEQSKQLTPAVLKLLFQKKWLRVLQPEYCGGPGWPLPRVVRLFEALARADANVGWCVNLGAGANMFAGYLPKEVAVKLFMNQQTWCAGSGAVSGVARPVAGGYRISGHWKYASGAAHATHFTANCYLQREQIGAPESPEGKVFRSFLFPAAAVARKDTWKVTGLKATSSGDFEVKDVFVPEQHTFTLLEPSPYTGAPLFRFPFDVLAVVNMACMPTGIALHFLELFSALAAVKRPLHSDNRLLKEMPAVKKIMARHRQQFFNDREEMYRLLHQVWQFYEAGSRAPGPLLRALSQAARKAADSARRLVDQLFPLCGMNILYTDAPINKVWRDMVAAGQHYLLSPLYEP